MKRKISIFKYLSADKPPPLGGRHRCAAWTWAPLLALVVGVMLMCNVAQAELEFDPELVDEGFRLWTKETWDGNGRTCGTCHIPKESYNIFPATLSLLPQAHLDLVFATNVPGLENIDLVASHALFNIMGGSDADCRADEPECWEGKDHPGPVFRSTMGIFGLAVTTANDRATFPGTPLFPPECSDGFANDLPQLGWSGDGSPGTPVIFDDGRCQAHHGTVDPDADGSIRAFANGAIAQHSTKSLNRIPGVDFRFATAEELDALDAFQKWLGRRTLTAEENAIQGTINATEFDITLLNFKDARVALGRDHFFGPPELFNPPGPPPPGIPPPAPVDNAGAGCNACHTNGGALSLLPGGGPPANINLNTDVELGSEDVGLAVVGVALPHDEGASDIVPPLGPPEFEGAFNIQSIIEAPQKKGWFHNHRAVDDFEEAISFYISDDFLDNAPFTTSEEVMRYGNAGSISFPNGDGIEHLGAFLRALNAFYNLRDCERLIDEAIERIGLRVAVQNPIRHCLFHLRNVIVVLRGSKLPMLHMDTQYDAFGSHISLRKYMRLDPRLANDSHVQDLMMIKAMVRQARDLIAVQTSPPPEEPS